MVPARGEISPISLIPIDQEGRHPECIGIRLPFRAFSKRLEKLEGTPQKMSLIQIADNHRGLRQRSRDGGDLRCPKYFPFITVALPTIVRTWTRPLPTWPAEPAVRRIAT